MPVVGCHVQAEAQAALVTGGGQFSDQIPAKGSPGYLEFGIIVFIAVLTGIKTEVNENSEPALVRKPGACPVKAFQC